MLSAEILGGRKVVLACEDSFLTSYVCGAMRHWCVDTIGPARSAEDLLRVIEGEAQPPIACISVNMPGVDAALIQALASRAVPYVLFGVPTNPAAWARATMLWPFGAFQLANELTALLTPRTEQASASEARRA